MGVPSAVGSSRTSVASDGVGGFEKRIEEDGSPWPRERELDEKEKGEERRVGGGKGEGKDGSATGTFGSIDRDDLYPGARTGSDDGLEVTKIEMGIRLRTRECC